METTHTKWITVEEMRKRLSISRAKAYEIATSDSIETIKIGRCLRINEESLTSWLDSLKVRGRSHD